MRVAARISSRLGYWLRLTVAGVACLWHAPLLLGQGIRSARMLVECAEAVQGWRLRRRRKFTRFLILPLRHYGALLISLPEIAGVRVEDYRRQIWHVYEEVQRLSAELQDGRSFLPTASARRLQRLLVQVAFEDSFSIRIDSEQATSFTVYAQTSEVVLDFLD